MFCGIDWAAESHDLCVVNPAGKVRGRATVAHSRDGFDELVKHLARWARQGEILVGIERPEGRLVDRILEAGYPIVLIPTFAMKDLRRRYAVGGAKSDPGDAYVIADVARTDGHRLRRLEPLSEHTRALRSVVRTRDDLVDQRVALGNQLRACLEAYWPGAAVIFADVDSEICLAFLERYPTPEAAAHLGDVRLGSFLKKVGYSGRRSAAELLERLRSAPTGVCGVEAEGRADAVRAMVRVMRSLNRSIKDLDRAVIAHLGEHPDAEVFTSLPRSGRINAAQMLAEWGDCREAYPEPDSVAMLGGLCPVTHASGKHRDVSFRWACNKRLRLALTTFADNSRHASPWAAEVYRRAVARGCDHPHAVRILARAWARIIWRCWQDRQPYNPALHGAVTRLEAA
ncbi:MAG: IS110 family transposase [Actinobacteria bacterium]|nr:IS110 family transposase [Actinomycetota bacterium]